MDFEVAFAAMLDDPGFCQAASQPEGALADLRVPNLLAINFVVKGLLGDGVIAELRDIWRHPDEDDLSG